MYFSNIQADRAKRFITASGWNEELRIENFYLSNINASVESAGKIAYSKNFRLKDIRLTVEDKTKVQEVDNVDSRIEIDYK